ncbi:hypothetical protein DN435_09650 [Lactobacillus reuteri]|uniref:hypothetical protein n=1 Tax=Limosilactobacillus reuteri TaxID=1598 RepID=UPI00128B3D4E|nr:hypothetical protein [Limosilactobacillus reuteri]MQB79644.1 hypothetical protein [Limosilactobacillus reuteri]
MNVKELKSAALKDAYRLKSYQIRVGKQCKRLEFVDDLIIKTSDYMSQNDTCNRPLIEAVMFLDHVQKGLQDKLLKLAKERDETLYHYNETLLSLDEKLGERKFESFVNRTYLTDLWNGNTEFEAQMKGLEK